ncbi:LmbE family protein [Oscillatoria nigro-viridis PCC 7112]|uniref:LmbE family protein n=1 Tax=Phormidium nigroviride PCC 7112 TaxID=179408 RepID=K9VD42_9CYAN|nr:LmbE family protein [Oscillatoria nigro-viridis PCC 7112]
MKKLAVQKHGSAHSSLPIPPYQTDLTLGETGLYISSEHLACMPVKDAPGAYFAPYN